MAAVDKKTAAADHEIVLTRSVAAPRAVVWGAWTDPEQLPRRWGPLGFTTETHRIDVRPGGEWRYVMRGPDARKYENLIRYVEVVEHERLRYVHLGGEGLEGVRFDVTVTLEDDGHADDRTCVTLRKTFASREARDATIREYNALEGGTQCLGRLAEYAERRGGTPAPLDPADLPFVATRVFAAPRDVVWRAWTERAQLMRWFGPAGCTIPHLELDLRPGGRCHYAMRMPDGRVMWGKWTCREIVPLERLVLVQSFSDEHGGVTRHPLSADWPLETLSTITFADHAGKGGGTALILRWSPMNPTEAERRAFDAGRTGMTQGWGGTFAQLDRYVAELLTGAK